MRGYIIKTTKGVELPEGEVAKPVYAGSQADGTEAKRAMLEKHILKRSQVVVEQIEIPTDKVGLIAFLNKLD